MLPPIAMEKLTLLCRECFENSKFTYKGGYRRLEKSRKPGIFLICQVIFCYVYVCPSIHQLLHHAQVERNENVHFRCCGRDCVCVRVCVSVCVCMCVFVCVCV